MGDPVSRTEYEALHAEVWRMRDRLHIIGTELTKLQIKHQQMERTHKAREHARTQRTVGISGLTSAAVAGLVYGVLAYLFGQKP
jgi:hypothetical protein